MCSALDFVLVCFKSISEASYDLVAAILMSIEFERCSKQKLWEKYIISCRMQKMDVLGVVCNII